jgi:predicted DNA-binding protein YlxM (UPF0122 family)
MIILEYFVWDTSERRTLLEIRNYYVNGLSIYEIARKYNVD